MRVDGVVVVGRIQNETVVVGSGGFRVIYFDWGWGLVGGFEQRSGELFVQLN